jgi:hypothetical protein
MRIYKTFNVAILLMLLITGCAINPTTDVKTLDVVFDSKTAQESFGLVQFDIHQIPPMGTDQAVANQFGLIGALVWIAEKKASNAKDFSIDETGVEFYRQTYMRLTDRLNQAVSFRYVEIPDLNIPDDVTLSRHIRDLQLSGSKELKREEIAAFCRDNHLDYALSSRNWGGELSMGESLFMNGQWNIYDTNGKLVASIFTRSTNENLDLDAMDEQMINEALLTLFEENIGRFSDAVNTNKP